MIDKNYIADKIREYMPPVKKTSQGWLILNCVVCHLQGEPTRDNQRKGNIIFNDGSFTYRCWRCKFKAHYHPGMIIGEKMTFLLQQFGMSDTEILNLKLYATQINQVYEVDKDYQHSVLKATEFKHIALPDNAIELRSEEGGDFLNNHNFCQVVQYAYERGEQIYNSELYWSSDWKFNKRLIIPFKYNGDTVGFTARYAGKPPKDVPRYVTKSQDGYLFNNHFLDDNDRKFVVLTEGPFDALAVNGVAYLKDTLSQKQINWLRDCDKEKILVPDKGKSAKAAIDQVVDLGWHVSMPPWDKGIKDIHDAYLEYGALHLTQSILEHKTRNPAEIEMIWKSWHRVTV